VFAQVPAIGRSSSGPINSRPDRAEDSGRAHSESGPYGSRFIVAESNYSAGECMQYLTVLGGSRV